MKYLKSNLSFTGWKTLCTLLIIGLLVSSCKDSISDEINAALAADFVVTVTTNPDEIISFEHVKTTYKHGDVLKLRINRAGFEVEEHNIQFDGVYESDGERLIFCQTLSDLVIGQGDSGSPILDSEGKVIAILCYGFEFANHQFAARAIEDVMSVEQADDDDLILKSSFKTIDLSYSTQGMTDDQFSEYIKYDDRNVFKSYKSSELEYQNKGNLNFKSSDDSGALIAGSSISLAVIKGTVINWSATGTASFVDEENIYAFGHSSSMSVGMPVYLAKMVTLIESSYIGYKLSLPTDEFLGVLVADQTEGILIDRTADKEVFEINTSIKVGANKAIIDKHDVAQFDDTYTEYYHAMTLPSYLVDKYVLNEFDSYDKVTVNVDIVMEFEIGGTLELTFEIDDYAYDIGSNIYYKVSYAIYAGDYSGHINSVNYTVDVQPIGDL